MYSKSDLPAELQNAPSLSSFKSLLNSDLSKCPKYFYTGIRKWQIYHARLRTECSPLNYHLFRKNITNSPLCQCGLPETNYHFFFECQQYNNIRNILFHTLLAYCYVTLPILLRGDNNLKNIYPRQQTFSIVLCKLCSLR